MDNVARIGPEESNPALKKYGEVLIQGKHHAIAMGPMNGDSYRPDLRVKEPNLRAFADIACSISSAWYACNEVDDMVAEKKKLQRRDGPHAKV